MLNCHFTLKADPLPLLQGQFWVCSRCGWVYPLVSDKPPRRNCPKSPDVQEARAEAAEKLGVSVEEVVQWGSYVIHWVAIGCPMRTDAEVAERLAICHDDCKHFRVGGSLWRKSGYCKICKCGVSASKFPLWNMVRMLVPGLGCKENKWPEDHDTR